MGAMLLSVCAWAQEDVTGQYLKNPSFELDDISKLPLDGTRAANGSGAYGATSVEGWTLSGSYMVSDIMTAAATATDNNFGAPGQPSDGQQMYYVRNAWSASQVSLLQTVKLPAGKYRITVDNKCQVCHAVSSSSQSCGRNREPELYLPECDACKLDDQCAGL